MKFLPTLALAGWTRRSWRAGRTITLSSLLHFHISLVKLNSSRPPSITLLIILILNLHRAGHSPSSSCYIGDKNCCTDRPRRSHSQIFERIKTVRFLISKYKFYCRQRMLHDNWLWWWVWWKFLFLFYSHPHLSLHEFSFAGGGVTDGLSTEKKWIRMERRVKRQSTAAVEMNMQILFVTAPTILVVMV